MVVKVCHQCSRLSKDILNQSLLDKWCAAEVSKMSDDEDMMKRFSSFFFLSLPPSCP